MKRIPLVLFSVCLLLRAEDVQTLDRQAHALFAQLRQDAVNEQAVEQLRGLAGNTNWLASPLRPYAMGIYACGQARKNNRQMFDLTVELIRKGYPKSPVPAILQQIVKVEPCVSCPKPQVGCRSCGFTGKCRKCVGTGQIPDYELKRVGIVAGGQERVSKLGESTTSAVNGRSKSCDVCGGSGACAGCGGKSSSAPCSVCSGLRKVQNLGNPDPVQERLLEGAAVIFTGSDVQRQTLAVSDVLAAADLLPPEKALAELTNAVAANPKATNLIRARERAIAEFQAVAVLKELVAVKTLPPSEAASRLAAAMTANPKASNLAQARAEIDRCRTIVTETEGNHRNFMASIRATKDRETARAVLFDRIKKEPNPEFRKEMDATMVELNQEIRRNKIIFYSAGAVAVLAGLWLVSTFFR